MRVAFFVYLILVINSLSSKINAQQFLEKHNEFGVQGFAAGTYGSGISLYDWNKDGFDDIVFLSKDSLPAFYLNTGTTFQRVFFDGITVSNDLKSVIWADFNNDGFPDLSFNSFNGGVKLYLNDGEFHFTDITTSSGVFQSTTDWGFGISWTDFNNDGFLDLFVSNYNSDFAEPGPNHLYKNNGNLTFYDVTVSTGINSSNEATFMGVWFDYNNDNKSDLLVLNDRTLFPNYLYKNQGAGQFTDVSQGTAMMDYMDSMSGTVGDYNNDGFLDVYVCNTPASGNKLYYNYTNGTFVDVAGDYNLKVYQWCWGSIWVDYNNDAFQDLFVVSQPFIGNGSVGNHYLYRNNNGTFDWQVSAGFAGSAGATFSTARGDFNNDGHPDIVTHSYAPLGIEIWMNQIQTGNYLKVALEGVISNKDAIGARITAYAGGIMQSRYTLCGEQYISQNSQWQHFGLGELTTVDSLRIKWPSGHQDVFYDVSPNQSLHIIEGSSISNHISIVQGNTSLCSGDSIVLDAGNWSQYQWSSGDSTRFITIYDADTISLVVRNANGFYIDAPSIIINHFSSPDYSINNTNPSCSGQNDGIAEILVTTSDSFEVVWSNGVNGLMNVGLIEDKYHFTIFYGQGCILNDSTDLFAPALLKLDSINLLLTDGENINCMNSYSLNSFSSAGTLPYSYNWYLYLFGESNPYLIIENQDEICISPDQNVTVLCQVVDANMCIDSMEINLQGIVSIVPVDNSPAIFPNPFENTIHIQSANEINDILISDVLGRCINLKKEYDLKANTIIYTSNLPSGIYIVRINCGNSWYNYRMQKK